MKNMIAAAIIIALAIPAVCLAAPPRPGFYVSGFLGATIPRDTGATTFDFVNGGQFDDQVEFDPGFNIGGAAGYDFGFLRLEGELAYKHSTIDSIIDKADGFRFVSVDGDIGAFSMLFNAYLDLRNNTPITPYFGGGVGFATVHLSDTFGVDTRDGAPQQALLYLGDDQSVFAYQAGAGIGFDFDESYTLDIGYRYFGTDSARFGPRTEGTTELTYESHNAVVGFRVNF